MSFFTPRFRPWAAPLAGALIFFGERVFPGTPARPVLDGLGVALLALSLGWALWLPGLRARGRPGPASFLLALPPALYLLGALFYFLTLTLPHGSSGFPDWAALLGWGWVLAVLLGAFPQLFLELSLQAQEGRLPPEVERLQRAAASGFALGLLLALIITLNFIFTRLPWQWDLAYFKTAEPGTPTLDIAESLQTPVEVGLFFPEGHAVLSLLESYFDGFSGSPAEQNLAVATYDAELNPRQATAFKARSNGSVILRRGTLTKEVKVGLRLARARRELIKFDRSFFAALLEVSSEKRVAYMTVGHGERNERTAGRSTFRTGMSTLRTLLKDRNFQVKPLGASEGLGREIPSDAALLLVVGPQEPFLPGETAAVKAFLERGGRLLVFMDPEVIGVSPGRGKSPSPGGGTKAGGAKAGPRAGLKGLLAEYGMEFRPALLANDRFFARRTFTKADHALLVTVGYPAHAAVSQLRRQAKQNPLLLLGAGAWKRGKPPAHLRLNEALKGMAGTWDDLNRNFIFDGAKEKREVPTLALALSPKRRGGSPGAGAEAEGPRVLAFADADLATDFLMQNRANRLLLAEAIRWAGGGRLPAGLPRGEEDVRIRHAKEDELVWFYLPVFAVPLFVLGLGYFLSGRPALRRRT